MMVAAPGNIEEGTFNPNLSVVNISLQAVPQSLMAEALISEQASRIKMGASAKEAENLNGKKLISKEQN